MSKHLFISYSGKYDRKKSDLKKLELKLHNYLDQIKEVKVISKPLDDEVRHLVNHVEQNLQAIKSADYILFFATKNSKDEIKKDYYLQSEIAILKEYKNNKIIVLSYDNGFDLVSENLTASIVINVTNQKFSVLMTELLDAMSIKNGELISLIEKDEQAKQTKKKDQDQIIERCTINGMFDFELYSRIISENSLPDESPSNPQKKGITEPTASRGDSTRFFQSNTNQILTNGQTYLIFSDKKDHPLKNELIELSNEITKANPQIVVVTTWDNGYDKSVLQKADRILFAVSGKEDNNSDEFEEIFTLHQNNKSIIPVILSESDKANIPLSFANIKPLIIGKKELKQEFIQSIRSTQPAKLKFGS